MPILLDNI